MEGGANKSEFYLRERSLLYECSAKGKKGAYLLIRKEGFSFVLKEEVSDDISFFVF
jgi:hypothetical protein